MSKTTVNGPTGAAPVSVLAGFPDEIWEDRPQGLRKIYEAYEAELQTRPLNTYGFVEQPDRMKFVTEQIKGFFCEGPNCLSDETVQFLLNYAYMDNELSLEFADDVVDQIQHALQVGAWNALNHMLYKFEQLILEFPDDMPDDFGLDEVEAEIFRALAPEYSGPLSELLENVRIL